MSKSLNDDEKEILRIISKLVHVDFNSSDDKLRHILQGEILGIIRNYYLEKTRQKNGVLTEKFQNSGINEDEGKILVSCARRLGFDLD